MRRRRFAGWFCHVCRFTSTFGDFADLGPRYLMCSGGRIEASTERPDPRDLVPPGYAAKHEPTVMSLLYEDTRTGLLA